MGEAANDEPNAGLGDSLDIVGKKKPRKNITQGFLMDYKEDKSMNGDQKTACIIVACISVVAICIACCITYYYMTTFQQAIEAGLEQQYGNGGTIWVKTPVK